MKKILVYSMILFLLCSAVFSGCKDKKTPEPTPALTALPTDTALPATPTTTSPVPTVAPSETATPAAAEITPTATQAVATEPTATSVPSWTPTSLPVVETPSPTPIATSATPKIAAAALVNGEPIPLAEFEQQVMLAESYYRKQAGSKPTGAESIEALRQVRRQVLDWMIDQLLIEQAARRLSITISEEQVETELQKAKGDDAEHFARWLKENGLTGETFRAKLRSELLGAAMRDAVTAYIPSKMEQIRLRHILVGSEAEARQVLRQIRSNEDFARLAKEHSLDMGTRDNGGDLGYYPRGILSPEIEKVAFNLVIGQISDVIQTAFGYHIIQVTDRNLQKEVSPQQMIALRQQAFLDWLLAERAKAKIEYLVD